MKFAFVADLHLSRYGQDNIEVTTQLPERLYSISMAWDNTEILKMPITISYRYFLENSPSAEQNTLSNTFI